MMNDSMIRQHIDRAGQLIAESLPDAEHEFSPASRQRAARLFRKYRWFEAVQAVKGPMKRAAAVAMVLLVFGFSGTMTVQANRRRAVETIVRVFEHYISSEEGAETPPPENPAIYTIEFGWLPDRMYETERIESEDFYYILFQTGDPDYPLEDDYVAFFLKKLESTYSGKIVGSPLDTEDLEQEAVTRGAKRLEEILAGPKNFSGLHWVENDTKDGQYHRYMFSIRTNAEAELSKRGNVLKQIQDNLIIHEEGGEQ